MLALSEMLLAEDEQPTAGATVAVTTNAHAAARPHLLLPVTGTPSLS
jgi:hypothetical protein